MAFSISPGVYVKETDFNLYSSETVKFPDLVKYPYQYQSYQMNDEKTSEILLWAKEQFGLANQGRWDFYSYIESIPTYPGHFGHFIIAFASIADKTLFLLTWFDDFPV